MSNLKTPPRAETPREKILGVSFFNGTPAEAVSEVNRTGGLLLCPASPALVKLRHDESYRRALQQAEVVLADSNFLAFLWRITTGRALRNVSGLGYLKSLLNDASFGGGRSTFWIVPSELAKQRAIDWLNARGLVTDPGNFCVAEPDQEYGSLQEIETRRPAHVVIATSGPAQEKLGLYYRDYLLYRPKIHCIGAALGFLTGDERSIPEWAERHHIGWLFRFAEQPEMIVPRLAIACLLASLVLRFREKLPPLKTRWCDR
ncbi:MAG: N-acetylglucosaminyldiphosphoundecaprenol N-acetyl-beta-D-mannosaminyltransferase [Verrucomicrobiota bacterium]|jgi:UDP-N-acetyl-D-mannosaminuronic acid transferase (WecB/TagA/CpsF family)